jgi:transposase
MLIIGLDYHPSFQQICFLDTESGDCGEQRLDHPKEAEKFYRELHTRGVGVRVGMEASGHSRWFQRLMAELGFELWTGDPAQVRARQVRKQKTDRQDAELLLRLMVEDRFPRIWVPDASNRDVRQLLWHRHRLVQMRTRVVNQLHAVALNEGLQRKRSLWRSGGRAELESLSLAPWASRRREDLLALLDQLQPAIAQLTTAVEQEAQKRPEVQRLMMCPGVGAITALAFVLVVGDPQRFANGKKLGSYLGLVPAEKSSGQRRRLGHISKQGNTLLRFLLAEAAQAAVRSDPEWRRQFLHLAMRRERAIAKVAMARKLAVSLLWMWRNEKFGSHAGQPGTDVGAP